MRPTFPVRDAETIRAGRWPASEHTSPVRADARREWAEKRIVFTTNQERLSEPLEPMRL